MKKLLFFVALILSAQANAMFCPNNFKTINIGDTIDTVTKLCGAPDEQKEIKSTDDPNAPQEWTFYVNPDPTNSQQTTNLKMTVAFENQKAGNITVNGQSLVSTTICGNIISVGDTMQSIKAACGSPPFVNKGQPQADQPDKPKVVEYKYNSTPPITLVFENGMLKSRK